MRIYNGRVASSHAVNWKWERGEATTEADFGDPVNGSTNYRLCVYDETGGTPQLVIEAQAPAGGICPGGVPCWYSTRAGYLYYVYDKTAAADGLVRLILQPTTDRRQAKIVVRGVTTDLLMYGPVNSEQLLSQDTALTLQLLRDDSPICWESVFTAPATRNNSTRFSDMFRP